MLGATSNAPPLNCGTPEDRCAWCSAGYLVAMRRCPLIRSVVEGCKARNVIVHAIGRMYDGLAAAAGRPCESEPRRNVAVVIRYAARERIRCKVVECGKKDDFVSSACVDAEIGSNPNLILREKVQEVEGDADIGVAAVAGEVGVGIGLAGRGIDRAGNGVEVLVKRADSRTAVLSREAAEAEAGAVSTGWRTARDRTQCQTSRYCGPVSRSGCQYAAAALRGSGSGERTEADVRDTADQEHLRLASC